MVTEIKNIEEALAALGVTEETLSETEKNALNEQGYIVLPAEIDRLWLAELRQGVEQAGLEAREVPGHREGGTRHISGLLNRGAPFERLFTYPKLLAAMYHILGEFKFTGMHARDPLAGNGQQGLHADWPFRAPSEPYQVANSIWMLDDFTVENGATRVVPGSHAISHQLPKYLADPAYTHPDELIVTAPAGSVLIFNGHLLHSGRRNQSQKPRRGILCSFSRREITQNQSEIEWDTFERLSPAAWYILGL
ncbi:MAG TPA: phytanoyl-CoA dioxygenase family protein [Chloroflexia bacterium]|nr:phytanoyl-CoA dioxygenase family protein [Chloroflexia bacterium]